MGSISPKRDGSGNSKFDKSKADNELPISDQDPNTTPSSLKTENLDQTCTKKTESSKLPPQRHCQKGEEVSRSLVERI